jgi:hypothetical protein
MPIGKVVANLNAATGIGYTGASATFWKAQVYEWTEADGIITWMGTWDNKLSTYTDRDAGTDTGMYLLIFEDLGDDIDILSGETIDMNDAIRAFTVAMPDIIPAMTSVGYGVENEYWLFFAIADTGGTTAVAFEPDRVKTAVNKQLAQIKDYGYVLNDQQIIAETRQIQDEIVTEETFLFNEALSGSSRITGPNVIVTVDNVQISENAMNGLVQEEDEPFTITEADFKHGDHLVVFKGGADNPLSVNAWDGVAFDETIEKAGGDAGDEGEDVSWFVEITDPLGASEAINFNNSSDPSLTIVTDIIDFGNRGIKSLEWIHVDWDMDASNITTVAIDYRYKSKTAWTRSAFKDLNQENMAYMGLAGIEFRVVVNCEAFADIMPNGPITVSYKRIDKRGIRGLDAN